MTFETNDQAHVTPISHPFGLRVTGEIDYGNHRLLAGALQRAIREGGDEIHLDLGELAFIDVAGLRVIVTAAARLSPPRRLILDPISPVVRRLLAVTGWERIQGLRMG
ncbi:STAS domain-containing protein [Nonomuraea sp. NPDC049784]|uniref:STAS domain-containing protein n=1 Tax=Nonomuraea sp. NPDC049784 TaxID=3154361 RepID=UPI0033E6BE7C